MNLTLPAYLVSVIHSSLDKRIYDRKKRLKKEDELYKLLVMVRQDIESQSKSQGLMFERVYTAEEF
jgi:hypothetical protein